MRVQHVRKRSQRGPAAAGIALVAVLGLAGTACDDDDISPPDGDAVLDVELVAQGLTAPVLLREAPDGSGRLFVVDQAGLIRVIDADGTLRSEPFLDLRSRMVDLNEGFDERGLLGLAFHPEYETNGRFFVYYSAPLRPDAQDFNHTSHVSEFTVSSGDPTVADPNSEVVLLQVDQPQFNHNAGTVDFGPDGYLYISLGDGGGGDDTGVGHPEEGNGQTIQTLLGSILRIDVDAGDPYAIPASNPFVGNAEGRDEIFAYGFRNPYRFSFDQGGTNMLLVGDAGQELYEEVSVVELGGNYGWNIKEGTHCFDPDDPTTPPDDCPDTGSRGEPLIDPVIEYDNAKDGDGVGIVVVGGFVYRGDAIPELEGRYIFGDWSQAFDSPGGQVFAATPASTGLWSFEELLFGDPGEELGEYVLGFGQDLEGEVYVLTSTTGVPSGSTGRVYRLVLE